MNGWALFFIFGAVCGVVSAFLWAATGHYALAMLLGVSAIANAFFAGQEIR